MTEPENRTPFIADQGLRLLQATGDPWRYLQAEHFRRQRLQEQTPAAGSAEPDPWVPLERRELVRRLLDRRERRRLVITTDAGVGKTTTLQWLQVVLGESGSNSGSSGLAPLALLLNVAELPTNPSGDDLTELVIAKLAATLHREAGSRKPHGLARARQAVERLLRQGRLILLLDGLDQTHSQDPKIQETLAGILRDHTWRDCAIVLGSRPYALEVNRETLFESTGPWQFVQLDEFSEPQQRRFLGYDRFEDVPEDSREILTIPRVLYYLRTMAAADLAKIHTASDVYWYATSELLTKGLKAKDAAGLTPNTARLLLAAIAFEMLTSTLEVETVGQNQMLSFEPRLAARCAAYYQQPFSVESCQTKLKQLAAMNEFLSQGLLEAGCPQQLQWRNRSLQEFFAGLWLSLFCADGDQAALGGMLFLDHVPASRRSYWMWRYAAEMAAPGRDPKRWLTAMAVLFQPGDGTPAGTRRSTEMIYRSSQTVDRYVASESPSSPLAKQFHADFLNGCVAPFQAEIAEILSGKRDQPDLPLQHQPSHIRREFLELRKGRKKHRFGFRRIPSVEQPPFAFRMGSPRDEPGRSSDEGPYDAILTKAFELACTPTTNEQYELFDPSHRERAWRGWDAIPRTAEADQCPVVNVLFYDAWAFCLWLGQGCRLPTEKEWEFACRAGSPARWCFGDDQDRLPKYAWGWWNSKDHKEHPVGKRRANAWGLCDVHGNVQEWCDTWYHANLAESDGPVILGSSRVLRGGSWVYDDLDSFRCAYREIANPAFGDFISGFRVARTLTP